MANFMALALARDVRLAELRGPRPDRRVAPRSRAARAYASDQGHFSVARALDVLASRRRRS